MIEISVLGEISLLRLKGIASKRPEPDTRQPWPADIPSYRTQLAQPIAMNNFHCEAVSIQHSAFSEIPTRRGGIHIVFDDLNLAKLNSSK